MAIGKMADLVDAAQGRFKPRSIPAMTEPDVDLPYREAFQRMQEGAYTRSDVAKGLYMSPMLAEQTPTPKAYSMPATQAYKTLVGGYRPSPVGLSSKGKYGGFMTASERDAAIAGAAMELSANAPSMLRSQAGERYKQVEDLRSKAFGSMIKRYTGGAERSPRAFEEASQYRAPGLRQYGAKLADWYTTNLAPAEEFLTTAQQLEVTPVSRLASSIAANAYGMNPQLAAGKFAGLDKTAFEERRNQEYLQTTGLPYEEYAAAQQGLAAQKKQQQDNIEAITGTPIGQIIDRSGMDQGAITKAVSRENIQVSETEMASNVADLVAIGMEYLSSGDMGSVNNLISGIEQYEGQADVARLIRAILGNEARKRERSTTYLQDYATIAP